MKSFSVLLLIFLPILAIGDGILNPYIVTDTTKDSAGRITAATIEYQNQVGISNDYYVKSTSPWIKSVNLVISYDSNTEFTMMILDSTHHRFSLPLQGPYPYTKDLPAADKNIQYQINIVNNPFSINVIRTATQELIFDTSKFDFVYSELALRFGVKLPSPYLYGLGERRTNFLLPSGTYTIFSRDRSAIDTGHPGGNLYGTHPLYMTRENSKNWHIFLFRNINAMDFQFDSTSQSLNFTSIGGIFDFKMFIGDQNPETAIKLYHNYANGIALTPFWAHGWHQSRWGLQDINAWRGVLANYSKYQIPIDTLWSDIDYLDDFQDFTISPLYQAPLLSEVIRTTPGLHWVPILDPGIAIANNPAYIMGMEKDLFIKSPNTKKALIAQVWPGPVHFPDFNHPLASDYWGYFLEYLHSQAPFSGVWIDMNELSNFCFGECNQAVLAGITSKDLPYVPSGGPLEQQAISLGAMHYGGVTELDFHGLNGFLEGVATRAALKDRLNMTLPFILSRSTSLGSGAVTQHWTGDNVSTFQYLLLSLSDIFQNQLFGNVMVGPDVCGFNGDTTETLCSYWTQLAAVYPFARNHNSIGSIGQMPWEFGPTLLTTARSSIIFRYTLLKWHYSIFVRNAGLGTTFRPTFYQYPLDDNLLGVDDQAMIGHELLVVPCLQDTQNCARTAYFPSNIKFYNFADGSSVHDYSDSTNSVIVSVPLNTNVPLFISGGSIVHTQNLTNAAGVYSKNSTFFLDSNFDLVVALLQQNDTYYSANGTILGVSNYTDEANLVAKCTGDVNCIYTINVTGSVNPATKTFTAKLTVNPLNAATTPLETIQIFRVKFYGVKYVSCAIGNPGCKADVAVIAGNPAGVPLPLKTTLTYTFTQPNSFRTEEILNFLE